MKRLLNLVYKVETKKEGDTLIETGRIRKGLAVAIVSFITLIGAVAFVDGHWLVGTIGLLLGLNYIRNLSRK